MGADGSTDVPTTGFPKATSSFSPFKKFPTQPFTVFYSLFHANTQKHQLKSPSPRKDVLDRINRIYRIKSFAVCLLR